MRRALAVAVGAALLTGVLAFGAGATAARPLPEKPSARFCSAFSDYFAAQFVIAFGAGFAQVGGDTVDPDAVKAQLYLVLSPRLEKVTGQMVKSAPRAAREALKQQLAIFRKGVALLKDAGVPDEAVKAIADADLTQKSDPTKLARDTKVSKNKLEAAGKKYLPIVEPLLSGEASSPEAGAAIKDAATQCGVIPDTTVACTSLLGDSDVAAALGGPANLDDRNGCSWTTGESRASDRNHLAVEVYASNDTYDRFVKQHDGARPVAGLGDKAVAAEGVSSQGFASTCGRTIAARADARTVQVALCRRDRDVTIDEVAGVVRQVLAKL